MKTAMIQSVTRYSKGNVQGTIIRLDDNTSTFLDTKYLQKLADSGLNEEDADFTLAQGCDASYDKVVKVKKGDALLDSTTGEVIKGSRAGVYNSDREVMINFQIDWTEGIQQQRELKAYAKARVKSAEKRAERLAALNAASKAQPAAEPVLQTVREEEI